MAITITLNGDTYTIPSVDDGSWGNELTEYLTAFQTALIQKTGGTFTLTNELDLGSAGTLTAKYFQHGVKNVSDDTTLTATDPTVIVVNNYPPPDYPLGKTITLPLAATCPGKIFFIVYLYNASGNPGGLVTIAPTSPDHLLNRSDSNGFQFVQDAGRKFRCISNGINRWHMTTS